MSSKVKVSIVFGIDFSGDAEARKKFDDIDAADGCEVARRGNDNGKPVVVVFAQDSFRDVFDGYSIEETVVDFVDVVHESVQRERARIAYEASLLTFCERHGISLDGRRSPRGLLVSGWS